MSKTDALQRVIDDAKAYAEAETDLEAARATLYESIRAARAAKATQQEIANCTNVSDDEDAGLSRQRIAQIIQEGKS